LELPEIFDDGKLTPDPVDFDDIIVSGARPPMSDDGDSSTMGMQSHFDLKELERETDMVVVGLDRR